jgi:hypothetical protein
MGNVGIQWSYDDHTGDILGIHYINISLAQTPTRGKPLPAEFEGGFHAMELKSCLDYSKGGSFNMVVDWKESIGFNWVCLKIGYIPNYSHLIGIMIINHWV